MAKKRNRAGVRGSVVDSGSESGSGSHYNSHDRECEALTFLYQMSRVWSLLDGKEVSKVVSSIIFAGDKYTKAQESDRICACGSMFKQHGKLSDSTLELYGENMGRLCREVLGIEKGQELEERVRSQGIFEDHKDE